MRGTIDLSLSNALARVQATPRPRALDFLVRRRAGVVQEPIAIDRELGTDLGASLHEALRELEAAVGAPLGGAELRVALGLKYCHVGMLELDPATAGALDERLLRSAAVAWAERTLQLTDSQAAIRFQRIGGAPRVLVSCIRNDCFETLQALARKLAFRFSSCQPALLAAIAAHSRPGVGGAPGTLVWSEARVGSVRSPAVQLFRLAQGAPVATWRGWIPAVAGAHDTALAGALRRFQARHGGAANESVHHERWLSAAPA
jgi:hypothetical protein